MNHQNQGPALEQRVNQLEKESRRLKLLLIALPALALLLGAESQLPQSDHKTVKAEKFVLVNSNGEERALLFTRDDFARLALLDEKGAQRVELRANSKTEHEKSGAHLQLSAENGEPVVTAGASDANGIGYVDFYDGAGAGPKHWKAGVGGGR
jgi:hypothetical protein